MYFLDLVVINLQSERSELKGFYISFFKESTLYVISFSYSSCRKKQSGMAGRLFVTDCCHFPEIIILYVTILSKEKHFLPRTAEQRRRSVKLEKETSSVRHYHPLFLPSTTYCLPALSPSLPSPDSRLTDCTSVESVESPFRTGPN